MNKNYFPEMLQLFGEWGEELEDDVESCFVNEYTVFLNRFNVPASVPTDRSEIVNPYLKAVLDDPTPTPVHEEASKSQKEVAKLVFYQVKKLRSDFITEYFKDMFTFSMEDKSIEDKMAIGEKLLKNWTKMLKANQLDKVAHFVDSLSGHQASQANSERSFSILTYLSSALITLNSLGEHLIMKENAALVDQVFSKVRIIPKKKYLKGDYVSKRFIMATETEARSNDNVTIQDGYVEEEEEEEDYMENNTNGGSEMATPFGLLEPVDIPQRIRVRGQLSSDNNSDKNL